MNEEVSKSGRFDRIKTRIQNEKIKQHLQDHKREYIAGAGGLAVGFVLFRGGPQVKSVVDAYKIQINSPTTNIVSTELQRRACPNPIPVLDKFSGESYASLRRASSVTGETLASISHDVHGIANRFERLPDSVLA